MSQLDYKVHSIEAPAYEVYLDLRVWREDPEDVDSWEQGAWNALDLIARPGHVKVLGATTGQSLALIEAVLDEMKSKANTYDAEVVPDVLVNQMRVIGREALDHVDYSHAEIVEILAKKQHDYGPGNILAFGLTGLHVRMSDKINRLRTLEDRGRAGMVDGDDSWLDLVGYAVIAQMLQNRSFYQHLEMDQPSDDEKIEEIVGQVRELLREEVSS